MDEIKHKFRDFLDKRKVNMVGSIQSLQVAIPNRFCFFTMECAVNHIRFDLNVCSLLLLLYFVSTCIGSEYENSIDGLYG